VRCVIDDDNTHCAPLVDKLVELAMHASGEDRARLERTIQLVNWAHRVTLQSRRNEQKSLTTLWQTKTLTLRLLVEARRLDENLSVLFDRAPK
jgi:hypothetical protein